MEYYAPEAELFFTSIFIRTNSRFNDVFLFRQTVRHCMPQAEELANLSSNYAAQSFMFSKEFKNIIIDKKEFMNSVGGMDGLVSQLVQNRIGAYKTSIDSASIVLAHSILDATAFDYCKLLEMIAPLEDWEPLVKRKLVSISIEDLKASNYEEIAKDKIKKHINKLDRKSLLDKINAIYWLCQPPAKYSGIKEYEFDKDRIKKFDDLRHEIVHGDGLSSPIAKCADEIKYMNDTAKHLMTLLNHKYKITMSGELYRDYLDKKTK